MVGPVTPLHSVVGLDSQDGGPPNAPVKRPRPRRAGGAGIAGLTRSGGRGACRRLAEQDP